MALRVVPSLAQTVAANASTVTIVSKTINPIFFRNIPRKKVFFEEKKKNLACENHGWEGYGLPVP